MKVLCLSLQARQRIQFYISSSSLVSATVHKIVFKYFPIASILFPLPCVIRVPYKDNALDWHYALALQYCGCYTFHAALVHIQCPVLVCSMCCGHSWRVTVGKAGEAGISWARIFTSVLFVGLSHILFMKRRLKHAEVRLVSWFMCIFQ